jgi:hypothetical protein
MNSNAKSIMSASKRLWTKMARFAEGLEGIDDPMGDCILSLGRRIEKLERDVERSKRNCNRVLAAGYSIRQ